jgi:hypothetical protein
LIRNLSLNKKCVTKSIKPKKIIKKDPALNLPFPINFHSSFRLGMSPYKMQAIILQKEIKLCVNYSNFL